MKKYLGVKIVEAEPMSKGLALNEGLVRLPKDENGSTIGVSNDEHAQIYEVDGYKVVYEDGYVSWSPNDVFEKAYKELQKQDLGLSIVFLNTVSGNWRYSFEGEDVGLNPMKLTFGQAIEALKQGKKVARAGWNGKGMWIKLGNYGEAITGEGNGNLGIVDFGKDGLWALQPSICMKTADGKMLVGWLDSQTDMLAEDWQIVE